MSEVDSTTEFATSGAEIVGSIAIEIEEWTVGDDPSPGALLAAVLGELAQAAFVLAQLEGDATVEEDDGDPFLRASAFFAAVAAAALIAAVRIHPETRDDPPLRAHAPLLSGLDDELCEWLEAWEAGTDEFDPAPSHWLRTVTSLLVGAGDGVARLEGRCPRPFTTGDDDSSDEDPDPDEVATAIADSLFQAAITAAAATQWFAERYGELCTPPGE